MTTKQYVPVTSSQPTCGPGLYRVLTAGVTIQLESWAHWHDSSDKIVVKDATGSLTPNITVLAPIGGAIDGQPSIVLTNQHEALIFRPLVDGLRYSVTG